MDNGALYCAVRASTALQIAVKHCVHCHSATCWLVNWIVWMINVFADLRAFCFVMQCTYVLIVIIIHKSGAWTERKSGRSGPKMGWAGAEREQRGAESGSCRNRSERWAAYLPLPLRSHALGPITCTTRRAVRLRSVRATPCYLCRTQRRSLT